MKSWRVSRGLPCLRSAHQAIWDLSLLRGPAGDAIFPSSKTPTFVVFQEASVAKFGFPDAVLYDKDADVAKPPPYG